MSIVGHAVIAAAGVGSRLGHGIPKALIDVCGRLIIEYQLHLLRDVEDVRVVVGYHERAVIAAVRRVRADVIFVRNPAYRHTTTLQSLHLAARDLRGKSVLILDGDTVYGARSFATFLETCRERSSLVSIADEISEDPVYANTAEDADGITGDRFQQNGTESLRVGQSRARPRRLSDERRDAGVREAVRIRPPTGMPGGTAGGRHGEGPRRLPSAPGTGSRLCRRPPVKAFPIADPDDASGRRRCSAGRRSAPRGRGALGGASEPETALRFVVRDRSRTAVGPTKRSDTAGPPRAGSRRPQAPGRPRRPRSPRPARRPEIAEPPLHPGFGFSRARSRPGVLARPGTGRRRGRNRRPGRSVRPRPC